MNMNKNTLSYLIVLITALSIVVVGLPFMQRLTYAVFYADRVDAAIISKVKPECLRDDL